MHVFAQTTTIPPGGDQITVQGQPVDEWVADFYHRLTSYPLRLGIVLALSIIVAVVYLGVAKSWYKLFALPAFVGVFTLSWSVINWWEGHIGEGQHQQPLFIGTFNVGVVDLFAGWQAFWTAMSIVAGTLVWVGLKEKRKKKEVGAVERVLVSVGTFFGAIVISVIVLAVI